MTLNNAPQAGIPEFTIADRMRKAREYAHLTQEQLADEIGISRRSISHIESGAGLPKKSAMILYALRTGVPREWLETGYTPRDLNPEPTGFGHGAATRVRKVNLRMSA